MVLNVWVFYVFNQFLHLMFEHFYDLALVNDWVKWVTHFVRKRSVDDRQQLAFSFWGVVQNFLRNVVKTQQSFFGVIRVKIVNLTFLKLYKLELGNTLLVQTYHALEISNNLLKFQTRDL